MAYKLKKKVQLHHVVLHPELCNELFGYMPAPVNNLYNHRTLIQIPVLIESTWTQITSTLTKFSASYQVPQNIDDENV